MQRARIAAVLLSLCVAFPAARSQETTPPVGLKALDNFVGSWETTSTNKVLPEAKTTVKESTSWILQNRFILGRESSQPDGVKSLWLMTYDPKTQSYPFVLFNNKGGLGAEWNNTWDDSTKTLTGTAIDTPPGWTSGGTNQFPNKDLNLAAFWMKDDSGKLLFDVEAKKSRQPLSAGKAMLVEWYKRDNADPPLPDELRVLERLAGSWTSTATSRPAHWTPRLVRTTRTYSHKWILDGRILEGTGVHSDGQATYTLWAYDPDKKAYRYWWFTSDGQRTSPTGTWDAAAETLTFKADSGGGRTFQSTLHFIDADHHDWQVLITDASGKVYLQIEGQATRQTK